MLQKTIIFNFKKLRFKGILVRKRIRSHVYIYIYTLKRLQAENQQYTKRFLFQLLYYFICVAVVVFYFTKTSPRIREKQKISSKTNLFY